VRLVCLWLDAVSKIIFFVLNFLFAKNQGFLEVVLRLSSFFNVNTRCVQIISLRRGLQYLIQAKNVAEKGFCFFLLINVMRHFMFILAVAISILYSSSSYPSMIFVSITCYSIVHYFIFSLCADLLKNKV
jgi:hypothetical protein